MSKRGVTFEQVRERMLALPGVEEGSSYGTPGFRVKGKFMSRLREDDVLVLKPIDEMERRFLMDTQPPTYFITDHYAGSDAILVRLSKARGDDLRGLIERCWTALAPPKLRAARDRDAMPVVNIRVAASRTKALPR